MIDSKFKEEQVLLFKNSTSNPKRNSFYNCYIQLVETKDFNALFDNKQEAYEKLVEI